MALLIEKLKTAEDSPSPMDWQEVEDHVQKVYQTLLNMKGENILVARDVLIRGRDGQNHQIDVYYEFELTGLRHRVAIECKKHGRPLEKKDVTSFCAIVNDCPGVRGCIVSASGYQKGAKEFAENNGINAITLADLPSILELLGLRLEFAFIPREVDIGQPFWTLYELDTGAPFGHEQNGKNFGILFYSKREAKIYKENLTNKDNLVVRGLSQEHLRAYILLVDAFAGEFKIVYMVEELENTINFFRMDIERKTLISDYYHGEGRIPEKPMIMPSVAKKKRTTSS